MPITRVGCVGVGCPHTYSSVPFSNSTLLAPFTLLRWIKTLLKPTSLFRSSTVAPGCGSGLHCMPPQARAACKAVAFTIVLIIANSRANRSRWVCRFSTRSVAVDAAGIFSLLSCCCCWPERFTFALAVPSFVERRLCRSCRRALLFLIQMSYCS